MKELLSFFTIALFLSYNITSAQTKDVIVDQQFDDNSSTEYVDVGLWNPATNEFDDFSVPETFPWTIGTTKTLRGFQGIEEGEKYKHWINNTTPEDDVTNHKSFQIYPTTNNLTSKFDYTYSNITIQTNLEETGLNSGVVEFRDPWFIDYQDGQYANQLRNRGMSLAEWRDRTSPFNPNFFTPYEYGQPYRGVFKDQSGPPNWIPPYYKVGVPEEQTISVHGQNRIFYHYYWEGTGVDFEEPPHYNQSGVVFTSSDAEATAVLKGQLMSNDQNGISSNSQRKIVRTDNGIYHIVYESMENVYYTHSLTTSFNGSWAKDEVFMVNAKNPSIDYYGNNIAIVYEFWDSDNVVKVYYDERDTQTGNTVHNNSFAVSNNYNDFGIIKPVVAATTGRRLIIYKKTVNSNLKYLSAKIENSVWSWTDEKDVWDTNKYSINPSVAGNKYVLEYHIVYQQSRRTIKYKHADYKNADTLRFCSPCEVSQGSGYTRNLYPSISIRNTEVPLILVSWQGVYTFGVEKRSFKTEDSGVRNNAVARVKTYLTWGSFNDFGSYVDYSNNGSLNTTSGSIITWSELDGQYAKYVKRRSDGYYDEIMPLSSNGIQPFVSNGSSFENIKASVFNNATGAPYLINRCTNDFSDVWLGKGNEGQIVDISYGRSGVVVENSIEFVFNIGDVFVDGETINFVERIDTLPISNITELNSVVQTEPFNLNSQSELIFSDYYYVINGDKADSLLTDEFNVMFKCELVNATSDEVFGTFDQITYDKYNVLEYNNPSYLVDCNGIESGSYYLRLFTAVNDSVKIFLSNIQRDDYSLNKKHLLRRDFEGKGISISYALSQNYPNPFNPSTIIKFQIPISGVVTLKIYDILGREVTTLVDEFKTEGRYEVNLNASSLASGVYLYRLNVNDYVEVKKMLMIK